MAKVTIGADTLNIELSLADKILAFHGSLAIPLEHVMSASVADQDVWAHLWHKIIGSSAPPFVMAGTYWVDGGLAFLDYHDSRHCLMIKTSHERYSSIIVQPDEGEDSYALAEEINKRVAA